MLICLLLGAFFSELFHFLFVKIIKKTFIQRKLVYFVILPLILLFIFFLIFYNPNREIITIPITTDTYHVGKEYKKNYPVKKEGGSTEYHFTVFLKRVPYEVTIEIETYDVDNINGWVIVNNKRIGKFDVFQKWKKNIFVVKGDNFKKGRNIITIKSNVWADGEIEDFLFRNLKLIVVY